MSREDGTHVENQILAALPRKEQDRILPQLRLLSLERGQVLYQPGEAIRDVYFPDTTLLSLLSLTESGESLEVGLIGKEGVFGIPIFLGSRSMPFRARVQISGTTHKMKADLLKSEFDRCGALHHLLLRYLHLLVVQTSQAGACNRFHTLQQRLCRWLLAFQEQAKSNELYFTQEFLAEMLGTNRTSTTAAAGALKQAGLIRYRHGHITILDEHGLQAAACECHLIIQRESQRLFRT
jgi:CRP-like cAMP-binding protein